MSDLPHKKHPCKDCPFRKDSLKGWLGKSRATEISQQFSFTCHKTKKELQCAGHMMVCKTNEYVALANKLSLPLGLLGQELVFESEQQFIEHHAKV